MPPDIDSSILDSIDVSELENLLKLNIQKGKAFSTLGQGSDGFKAFQSALDVSINLCCTSLPRFFQLIACFDKFRATDTSLRSMCFQQ